MMPTVIDSLVEQIGPRLVADRRDFHRHAETGWTEFRTASLVARRLVELGYEVQAGRQVVRDEERMGLPDPEALERHWQRARRQGGDPEFLEALRGGFTGVVGSLACGPGPTVALRFDMDALDLVESASPDHRPVRAGFASVNDGAAHACGHDGHVAVGLGLASVLAQLRGQLGGTVRLIFQPAEEGVRGARAMVAAGVVDGVDYVVGHHLFSGWELGAVEPGRGGYLATTKFDAFFTGAPAHAGGRPQEGRNALLAAATAVLNLHAISRHKDGATRINVGRLVAGTGRNVIPASAHLVVETRGASTELNDYVYAEARRILEAAAAMHGCGLEIKEMGAARSATSDEALMARVARVAASLPELHIHEPESGAGSEDFTYMMARVQENGGQATNIGLGADLGGWGHHTAEFDLDERALPLAVRFLASLVADLLPAPDPSTILNFLPISETLATAGQPARPHFAALRDAGYQVVINLALPTSTNALPDEAELVTACGMEYVPIPVVWESPALADVARFFEVMDRHQGHKVLVHCALNMRVSAFCFLYRVLRQGVPHAEAWQTLLRIWEPDGAWADLIQQALARGVPPSVDQEPTQEKLKP